MALRLGGKLLYGPVDWALQGVWAEADELPRYRCIMSVCTVFCFAGVIALIFQPAPAKAPSFSRIGDRHVGILAEPLD